MLKIDEIKEFDDIDKCIEFGSLVVARLLDDTVWYASRDLDYVSEMNWRSAPVNMIEALDAAILEEDEPEEFIRREEESDKEFVKSFKSNGFGLERDNMLDFTGSSEKYINDFFGNAFEPAFGSDFSL